MMIHQYTQASIDHLDRCEDAVLICQNPGCAPVFVVIDGMGGHQHQLADGSILTGREAAQFLGTVLAEELGHLPADAVPDPGSVIEDQLIAAVSLANERLYTEINQGETRRMGERVGAVLTIGVLCDNGKRLLCLQVGDTRGYFFTEGELIQLCYDEDNIEFMVQEGLLSADDGARIRAVLNQYDGVNPPDVAGTVTIGSQVFDLYVAWRWFLVGNSALGILPPNIVLNALGLDPEVSGIQLSRIEVNAGDQLLLCSDGLYKNMSDTEIITRLQQPGDSAGNLGQAAFARSQDQSNQRRSRDDISALVVIF